MIVARRYGLASGSRQFLPARWRLNKRRILHLISQVGEGGAQRQLSYILSHSQKYEMEVASLVASTPDDTFPYFRNCPYPLHFLSYSADFYAPQIIGNLRRLLQEGKYSLVHCWMFESIVQGAMAARLADLPCVAGVHGLPDSFRFGGNKKWEINLIRKNLQLADLAVFPSHTAAIDFVSQGWVNQSSVRVIYNSVDCEQFLPAGEGAHLLTIGRISAEKGYPFLASVMKNLRTEFPEIKCIAAGGGKSQPIEGVEFVGFLDDVRDAIRQACIYLTTSETEALSCSLLETQAMGLPAVTRNVGSNSEVIEDGVNGFLASGPEEFAERCRLLWSNKEMRLRLGENARKRMLRDFSVQRQVQGIEQLYDELL